MNRDWILWFVVFVRGNHPHALYDIHATIYSTENGVLVIKPRRRLQRDKELTEVPIQGEDKRDETQIMSFDCKKLPRSSKTNDYTHLPFVFGPEFAID